MSLLIATIVQAVSDCLPFHRIFRKLLEKDRKTHGNASSKKLPEHVATWQQNIDDRIGPLSTS